RRMTIHRFQPTHYHVTIGSHEPILRIADGDTVITWTVDAGGTDARGEQVTPGGNPQTGPFYIAGAEPGVTLAVHLVRVEPSRERGFSGSVVAPNVVDPAYVRELPERQLVDWRVDRAAGTATLDTPDSTLGPLTLPL